MQQQPVSETARRAYLLALLQEKRQRLDRGHRERAAKEDREILPRSLRKYVEASWHLIEPSTPFISNWHIDAICEHLEALTKRQIRNLIITIPPRMSKSTIFSVMWPTWIWTFKPQERFLFASYADSLSLRDAVRARRIIASRWYQDRWGALFSLTGDQNVKGRYDNTSTGYRLSTSVGGIATGEGGDVIGVDDPHNILDIESEAKREEVLEWWDNSMSTRLNDPNTGVRGIIMQRSGFKDLVGHILTRDKSSYVHLNLPMRYERPGCSTVIGWKDPRKEVGELLMPQRFGEKATAQIEATLGERGTAAQFQQRPSPAGGGLVKRNWFKLWPRKRAFPAFDYIIQIYDTALTDKDKSDSTGYVALGVFEHRKRNVALVLEVANEKWQYPKLRKHVALTWKDTWYGPERQERRADEVLVENKGSGISLLQDLGQRIPVMGVGLVGAGGRQLDKESRLKTVSPIVECGLVYVPESSNGGNVPAQWVEVLLHQVCNFPAAGEDDVMDAFVHGLQRLRSLGLVVPTPPIDELDDGVESTPVKVVNPYAS